MSAYGFDVDADPSTINTINLTTGEWMFLDFLPPGIFPAGCAYDCFTDILYVVDFDGQLYSKNPALTGSFVTVGTPQMGLEFGLTFDSMNNKLLGCNFNSTDTFEVDRVTGVWTSIGPTLLVNGRPVNLAYDCFNDTVYGVAVDFGIGAQPYRIYTVNPGPGVGAGQWTEVGSTGLSASSSAGGGMMWAPSPPADTTDTLYFSIFLGGGEMYKIDKMTGSATLLGPTNTNQPWPMFVTSPCCCVHEDSLVQLANGQQAKICEVKADDVLLDFAGRPRPVLKNVCTGRRTDFVKIPANSLGINEPKSDLLIQSGHPILYQGKEIECQDLTVSEKVQLENRARIFTLITGERTFVNIEGVMVGTWSQAAFDNFVANDSSGRCLPIQ